MAKKSKELVAQERTLMRAQGRIKKVIESLVTIPIHKLDWPELEEWVEKDPELELGEVLHLVQIRKAVEGNSKSYEMIQDRMYGKPTTSNVQVSGSYKDFLDELGGDTSDRILADPTGEKLAARRKPNAKPSRSKAMAADLRKARRDSIEAEFEALPEEDANIEDLL